MPFGACEGNPWFWLRVGPDIGDVGRLKASPDVVFWLSPILLLGELELPATENIDWDCTSLLRDNRLGTGAIGGLEIVADMSTARRPSMEAGELFAACLMTVLDCWRGSGCEKSPVQPFRYI